jgi:hypothetical protein
VTRSPGPGSRSNSSLDRVDGCVRERTDGTRDKTNQGGLDSRQTTVRVLGLVILQKPLEFGVGGKVGGCRRRRRCELSPVSFLTGPTPTSSRRANSPWLVACRRAVRATPRYNVEGPSSRRMSQSACAALRYLGTSSGSVIEWTWACNRILTTSIGHTTRTASVTPAPRPAAGGREQAPVFSLPHTHRRERSNRTEEMHVPRKMPDEVVFPVSLLARRPLYCSNEANRIAIFGTMPVTTAPRPL